MSCLSTPLVRLKQLKGTIPKTRTRANKEEGHRYRCHCEFCHSYSFYIPRKKRSSNIPYCILALVFLCHLRGSSFCVSYTFLQTGKFIKVFLSVLLVS